MPEQKRPISQATSNPRPKGPEHAHPARPGGMGRNDWRETPLPNHEGLHSGQQLEADWEPMPLAECPTR